MISKDNFRIEKDSMGEMRVPADAHYGAQTERAVENFPISNLRFPTRVFSGPWALSNSRRPKRTWTSASRQEDR